MASRAEPVRSPVVFPLAEMTGGPVPWSSRGTRKAGGRAVGRSDVMQRIAWRVTVVSIQLLALVGCAKKTPPPVAMPPFVPADSYVTASAAAPGAVASSGAASHVWPRTYQSVTGDSMVLYQPQVDSWTDQAKIRFRAAVALTL